MSGIKKILFLLFAGNLLLSADTFQENRNGSITLDYQTGKTPMNFMHWGKQWKCSNFADRKSITYDPGYPKNDAGTYCIKGKWKTKPDGLIFNTDVKIKTDGTKMQYDLSASNPDGIQTTLAAMMFSLPYEPIRANGIVVNDRLHKPFGWKGVPMRSAILPFPGGKTLRISSNQEVVLEIQRPRSGGATAGIVLKPVQFSGLIKDIKFSLSFEISDAPFPNKGAKQAAPSQNTGKSLPLPTGISITPTGALRVQDKEGLRADFQVMHWGEKWKCSNPHDRKCMKYDPGYPKKEAGSYRIKGKLLAGPDKTPCDVEVSVTPGEKNSFLYDFKLSNPDGITTSMAGGYLKMDWPVTPPKQFLINGSVKDYSKNPRKTITEKGVIQAVLPFGSKKLELNSDDSFSLLLRKPNGKEPMSVFVQPENAAGLQKEIRLKFQIRMID